MTKYIKCANSFSCLKALLANGAAVNAKNNRGMAALIMAAERGHLQIVEVSI